MKSEPFGVNYPVLRISIPFCLYIIILRKHSSANLVLATKPISLTYYWLLLLPSHLFIKLLCSSHTALEIIEIGHFPVKYLQ